MTNKNSNIEDLFRDAFESFDHPVDPSVWSNISAKLPQSLTPPSPGESLLSKLAGSTIAVKSAIGVISVAVITAGIVLFNNIDTPDNQHQIPIEETLVTPVTENDPVAIDLSNSDLVVTGEKKENKSDKTKNPGRFSPSQEPEKQYSSTQLGVASDQVNSLKYNVAEPSGVGQKSEDKSPVLSTIKPSQEKSSISPVENENSQKIPIARISASVLSGPMPLEVTFSNSGFGANPVWRFGDGTPSVSRDVVKHVFSQEGVYFVSLTTTASNGISFSDTIVIEVLAESGITFIPNVFTPNGDGINDIFEIQSKNILSLTVKVFDTQGKLINSWDLTDGYWDGKLPSGELAGPGNYFYQVVATGKDRKQYKKNGTLRLIR
jgi:gliding motility-associated-like protein